MKGTTQADKALLKEERLAAKAEKRAAKQKQLTTLTQKGAGEQPPGFWRNPPSFLFYMWYSPLLRLGFKRPLQWEDLFALPTSLECNNVYPEYEVEWKKQLVVGESTAKVPSIANSIIP